MYKSSTLLRAGLAAGTIGTLFSASALFAGVAMADTTGYQTGYTYHQGLATGAGAQLVNKDGSMTTSSADPGTTDTTVPDTTVSESVSQAAPSTAAVDTTGDAAVTADTNTAQAAAAEPAASADTATAPSVLTSQPFMLALWVVLGLAVLALIAMGISAIVTSMGTGEEYGTRRRVSYQN